VAPMGRPAKRTWGSWSGRRSAKEAPAVLEQIRALQGEFTFETFVSLSCQSCPTWFQALNFKWRW